ncbi:MAG: Gfo/Idh/MocA family oxidoreductase [Leptospiraceae bacterium]
MKILVVGLGSMGKRRVRNLQALGVREVYGFDPRPDRREEALKKYDIQVFQNFEEALVKNPDIMVISTPPDLHMEYAFIALERKLHCFIEASVVDADRILELGKSVEGTGLVFAPSCTMRYFPGPAKAKELVQSGVLGRILTINYHVGQYLPDWHPWEDIQDYYVSKPETGGAREIVPFELTWLNDVFGPAIALGCHKAKQSSMSAHIDDVYFCLCRYESGAILNLTVEVLSRPKATRELRVLGEEGELVFSSDTNSIRFINTSMNDWEEVSFAHGTLESNYINPEEPYIAEMRDFLRAIRDGGKSPFPNTLTDDHDVLQLLYSLEREAVR